MKDITKTREDEKSKKNLEPEDAENTPLEQGGPELLADC